MKVSSRLPFRSVDEWKSALMTLPDNNFFELFRSVFGNIKTPFNKQRLLDDLFILLSRDEICKTIAAYIDGQDHKIIAAVALLNEPAQGDLESFFAGELSVAELHALVLNLEERLILYRFRDEGILRLALNPVLEKVLVPFIRDARPLFPSYPLDSSFQEDNGKKDDPLSACICDGCKFAALFAFIYSEEEQLKMDPGTGSRKTGFERTGFSGLRKKFLDEGKKIFPGLDLELAVRILLHLGLFRSEGPSLVPCRERIAEFSDLFPDERQEYWAAGLSLCLEETANDDDESNNLAANGSLSDDGVRQAAVPGFFPAQSFLSRNRMRRIALFIHGFMSRIEPGRKYPETTLRRTGELLERDDGGTGSSGFQPWSSRPLSGRAGALRAESLTAQFPFESFLAVLEKTGLLKRDGTCWKTGAAIAAEPSVSTAANADVDTAKPVIVMDTTFSFVLYPEISFADALELAAFCTVKEPASSRYMDGNTICFEISRQSAVRGFDQGLGAAAMMELLNRLSLERIDTNLDWTLKDWESRYEGVSLHQGIILSLAEDHRYLADARPIVSLIRRTLAPGVYLLSSEDRAEVTRALRRAGVDIVAQPPSNPEPGTDGYFRSGSFPCLGSSTAAGFPSAHSFAGSNEEAGGKVNPEVQKETESIKEKFRQVLKTMQLTKQERDELEARIERRLVLSETQLERSSLRYEKLEARGIDYQGKTAIAKQAIATGSLLEVSWPAAGGEIKRVLGIPTALEKKEKESILVLKSYSAAEGEKGSQIKGTISIPLGKISLLRRIKRSIFGE